MNFLSKTLFVLAVGSQIRDDNVSAIKGIVSGSPLAAALQKLNFNILKLKFECIKNGQIEQVPNKREFFPST